MTLSSLFRRIPVALLAVAAAGTLTASLCAPTRAATADYDVCQADLYTPKMIISRVHLNLTDDSQWNGVTFHTQLLGGNEKYDSPYFGLINVKGPGDFYFPSKVDGDVYHISVNGGGTYNNWAICDGGSSGGAWYASTGGTTYVYIP
jgi:hypothetical protein